jgi:type II secretory pathway pseudopilin PulG
MSAVVIAAVVFACVFGGALFGMFLGAVLPKHHLSSDARDVIKVAMAMIATLAALVLGLLTASAKSSLDEKESELRSAAAQIVLLDRTMAEYGAETQEARDLLKQTVVARISQIWPEENAKVTPGAIGRGSGIEAIQRKLLDLSPQTDAQRWLQSTALQISGSIAAERWAVLQQIGSSIQWPFMAILVFWLAIIFASFGLFAPRNASVTIALLLAALSVAGSVYLILEMDQPYSGLIKISSAPLRVALQQLGQP